MVAAGRLIWISLRPLLRLIITVSCGFAITKADIFPAVAARGVGQILLNITLPSLMFSKIVPAFTSSNINALGPLVLVAVIYESMGMVMAWIIRYLFWVPHRFRWGILVAGGWGNYGDIPTAVVMSITGAAPFKGAGDQTLSVAYISGFILVYMITFFPMGGSSMVGLDYIGPDVEDDEIRERVRLRRRAIFSGLVHCLPRSMRRRRSIHESDDVVAEKKPSVEEGIVPHDIPPTLSKHVSFESEQPRSHSEHNMMALASTMASPAPTVTAVDTDVLPTIHERQDASKGRPSPPSFYTKHKPHLRQFIKNLLMPGSAAIIISFIIALVPDLKALFVPNVPGTHIPNAPDDQPPLAFVLDTATFIGAASVPIGLVSLGAALARLRIPTGAWKTLPSGAILALAFCKMLLSPVLGVLICTGLTRAGVISSTDKVLQFVCIFFSCLPTATTQVFVTQVASGTGSAEPLSAFLLPQYALMLPAMTGLIAYTLQALF